jgi:hypothetical protein
MAFARLIDRSELTAVPVTYTKSSVDAGALIYQGGTSIVSGASIFPGAARVCASLTGGVGLGIVVVTDFFSANGLVVLQPASSEIATPSEIADSFIIVTFLCM